MVYIGSFDPGMTVWLLRDKCGDMKNHSSQACHKYHMSSDGRRCRNETSLTVTESSVTRKNVRRFS